VSLEKLDFFRFVLLFQVAGTFYSFLHTSMML
jgi:hypothetical protein